jgi:hypothetical protein
MSYSMTAAPGLGFDQQVQGADGKSHVITITRVANLPNGTAPQVPSAIVRAFAEYQFPSDAQWLSGGSVRVRYASIDELQDRARRGFALMALATAAEGLGPSVYFDVQGHGRVPASAGSAASAPGTTSIAALELQQLLQARGFNPGSLDGRWGENTSGALQLAAAAAGHAGAHGAVGSQDRRSVSVATPLLSAVRALPTRSGSATPAPPAPPAPAPVSPSVPDAPGIDASSIATPLLIAGAGALVLIGGFFLYRGRRRRTAMAANRRRRARSKRRQ